VALVAPASPVLAQTSEVAGSTAPRIDVSDQLPRRPEGFAIGAREAIRVANRDPKVDETRERYGRLEASAEAEPATWQVGYFAGDREVAQVLVDAPTGTVRESWTGDQVAWQMARGYEGSFGHKLNAPYVWLPLCAIFLLGLLDWRRPGRLVHLDLVVLLAFGISHMFFNRGEIGVSVPLAYPVLLYLLARLVWIGFRGRGPGLLPSAPIVWLAIAAAFLVGFRIALNVADSGVIDVGYSGVIGADRVVGGEPLYGEGAFPDDNPFGDTYGPVNYYAYIPFELAMPWSGEWDELAAGHAAAIFFDLAVVAMLLVIGKRLRPGRRGRDLGVVLAFAWAAFPYTAYALQSNANDSLVGALVLAALLLLSSPVGRGAMTALAALVKFAPLALAPLFAAGPRAGLARPPPRARGGSVHGRSLRGRRAGPGTGRGRSGDRDGVGADNRATGRPRVPVLDLGPGTGAGAAAGGADGRHRGIRDRRRLRPAPPLAPARRRPGGGDPDRAPAHGRALVLPLHRVVPAGAAGGADGAGASTPDRGRAGPRNDRRTPGGGRRCKLIQGAGVSRSARR
jgi:hypothetical protein